jgi:hypothetical protein
MGVGLSASAGPKIVTSGSWVLVAMASGFWKFGVRKFGSLGISEFSKILKIMRVAQARLVY